MFRVAWWRKVDQNHGELTGTLSHAHTSRDWTDDAAADVRL